MYTEVNKYDITNSALKSIRRKIKDFEESVKNKKIFLGFDGYIDSLYSLVRSRNSINEHIKMNSMKEFGERIISVAGSSANIERILKRRTFGGFAPNTSSAFSTLGVEINLIASLGYPKIKKVFKPLISKNSIETISFANPGETIGLEFNDGKLMLTDYHNIHEINWELLNDRVGMKKMLEIFENADGLGFGHWSSIPSLTNIWKKMQEEVFPSLNNLTDKIFFIDLADIKKWSKKIISEMLQILQDINNDIPVLLSLNDQEAKDISMVLNGISTIYPVKENLKDYYEGGKLINEVLTLTYLVIHTPYYATITTNKTQKEHYWIAQAHTSEPKYTTGAGEHFHSGVIAGLISNLSPAESILLGNVIASLFIRTGKPPNIKMIKEFLEKYENFL